VSALPCGCCEPTTPLTPADETNRAGLSAIAYRVGTYASFRESMLEQIVRTPGIADLRSRRDDDYAVTLIDLWAAVADVLSFYQERYANEAYLRTAKQRESIGRLARLIDYSLRPGVAALAWLAFTVEDGKMLHVAKHLRVQSVPGQDEQPQVFETLEEIQADARLNRVRLMPAPYGVNPLGKGAIEALIAPGEAGLDAARGLQANDRVAAYSTGASGSVELLAVREVRVEEDRVAVVWRTPVRGTHPPGTPATEVARVLRPFGHNAAEQSMTAIKDSSVPGGIRWSLDPTSFRLPASGASTSSLPLDAKVEGITPGTRLLVHDTAGATTLVTVTAVTTAARTLAGLTDSVTVLGVTPAVPAAADRRTVAIYELVGPDLPFWGYDFPERIAGGPVHLAGRLHGDGSVEIGRTITRFEYQPGARLSPEDVAPGRTVLLGDAVTDPAVARVGSVDIVGPTITFEATANDATSVKQLGLDAGSGAARAGLLSGELPFDIALSSAKPALKVRVGDVGPRTVSLTGTVATIVDAASVVQAGLNAAGPEPELTGAQVYWLNGRLIVYPGGTGGELELFPTDTDGTTVRELGLDRDQVLPSRGLVSAPLTLPLTFTNASPEVAVSAGAVGPRILHLANATTLKGLAVALQVALMTADPSPAFAKAVVLATGNRLLVLPGPVGAEIEAFIRLDLTADEPYDLDAATAFLLGNVAAGSHGETVHGEVLGDGDASTRFQRFPLKKKPLTYVPSTKSGGVESSLEVLVDRLLWDEVPGLYGQGPTAQVYRVRENDDGTTIVQFGDGRTGAPVPTGGGNVSATYRVGAGVAGRVRRGTLTTALDRPPGLKEVTNPLAARGGADPETIDYARENAPTTVRTFGRAVSLLDFADLVRASGEVAKAQAIWIWDGLDRAIHLTIAGQRGGLFLDEDLRRIGAALARARDANYQLRLANFMPLPIVLSGTVQVDGRHVQADVLPAVRAAVLAALDFDAVSLGTPLHLSDLYRVVQDVPGVLAADIDVLQPKRPADRDRPNADRLEDGTPAPLQTHVRVFPARPDPAHPGVVLPAELASIEDVARDVVLTGTGGIDA
jgi:hypothetical protein